MNLYLRKTTNEEIFAIGEKALVSATGKFATDIVMTQAVSKMTPLISDMGVALGNYTETPASAQTEGLDKAFDKSFVAFRVMAETQAEYDELGKRAEASAVVAGIIDEVGRDFYKKNRTVQVSLSNVMIDKIESMDPSPVDQAGLRPLWTKVVKNSAALEANLAAVIQEEKQAKEGIAPSKIADQIRPVLSLYYNHLENGADLEIEEFQTTLTQFRDEVSSIVTGIKSRMTRKENEQEA